MNRATLIFCNSGDEYGFLHHCANRLVQNLRISMLFIFTVSTLFFVRAVLSNSMPDGAHDYHEFNEANEAIARSIKLQSKIIISLLMLTSLLCVVVFTVPGFRVRVGLRTREYASVLLMLQGVLSIVFGDRIYISRLYGLVISRDKMIEIGAFSDSLILMVFSWYLVASHFVLPIRWHLLVPVETAVVFLYGLCAFGFGSADSHRNGCFIICVFLVLASAVGKRHVEYTERVMFSHYLAEKTLRAQAEFQLSQSQAQVPHSSSELDRDSSAPTTTDTGRAFVELEFGHHFEAVEDIGRREHWLLGEDEIHVLPAILGMGGFGIVLAGSFHTTPVAIKLSKNFGSIKSFADMGNELRLLRKLRHPNITALHGACVDFQRGLLALVMELVPGVMLEDFICSTFEVRLLPSDDTNRCHILAGVCKALLYLHTRSPCVVHGDLKPGNVLVECRNKFKDMQNFIAHAKLLDFGLSRLCTKHVKPLGGTFRWMAPEVIATRAIGDNQPPKPPTDVFSLGRLMFFITTGLKPMADLNEKTVQSMILPLAWPLAVPLAQQCMPLAEHCMLADSGARPSMQELSRLLMSWPQFKDMSPGYSAENFESVSFWADIQKIRDELQHGHLQEKRAGVVLMPTLPVVPKYKRAVMSQLNRLQDPLQFVHPGLRTIPECENVAVQQPIRNPLCQSQFVYPSLLLTDETTMNASIVDTLLHWNFLRSSSSCCTFHAALELLGNVSSRLRDRSCNEDLVVFEVPVQCPNCKILLFGDADGADGCCFLCNHSFSQLPTSAIAL